MQIKQPIKPTDALSRQMRWQMARRVLGMCIKCGKRPGRVITFKGSGTRVSVFCTKCS